MLAALFGRWFWIPAYLSLAGGLLLPGDWSPLRPLVPFALGGILYFTCLRISWQEFSGGMRDPALIGQAAWMSVVKLLALPLAAWALILPLSAEWAAGVALVCLMPAGLSSSAFADLFGGNRILALVLIALTSLLAPFTVPLALMLVDRGGPAPDPLLLVGKSGFLLALLASPFLAAQATRALAPAFVARYHHYWGRWSIGFLCFMILIGVGANRGAWASLPWSAMLMPLLLCTLASVLAAVVAWSLRPRVGGPGSTVFACAAIYMNNGLGLAYASQFYPGNAHMILPSVAMQIPMLAVMAGYGSLALRHAPAPAPASTPPR